MLPSGVDGDEITALPDPPSKVLDLHAVSKTFGGLEAVRDVSMSIYGGRVIALIGENGSGKTTLVNVISGLLRPTKGHVEILGADTAGLSPARVARLGCSRTFQLPHVILDASVRENVELGLLSSERIGPISAAFLPWRSAKTARQRRARAQGLCLEVGITSSDAATRMRSVPLGIRRLAEVARALASEAPLICLDEPAVGLEESELRQLSVLLRKLAARGRAVIVVAHDARFVLDTCHDVVLMRRGMIVGEYRDVRRDSLPGDLVDYFRHLPFIASSAPDA
jgi:ABC-type branched-subunit amino acid transport system ATPase component